jgi:hypothetical protein
MRTACVFSKQVSEIPLNLQLGFELSKAYAESRNVLSCKFDNAFAFSLSLQFDVFKIKNC